MKPDNPRQWALRVGDGYEYVDGLAALRRRKAEGRLSDQDEVWDPGAERWRLVSVIDLRSLGQRLEALRTKAENLFGALLALLVMGGLALWLGYSGLVAPHQIVASSAHGAQVSALTANAVLAFSDPQVRVEERGGANVRVYVAKSSFEGVPFPDRDATVEALGTGWCASVEGAFLPSVTINDIRNGRQLAKFGCTGFHLRTWWREEQAKNK